MLRGYKILLFICVITALISCQDNSKPVESYAKELTVIPSPNKILKRGGTLSLTNNFWVIADISDSLTTTLASYAVNKISTITGRDVMITDLYSTRKHDQSVAIELKKKTDNDNAELYTLNLTRNQILLTSSSSSGIKYGIESLSQLLLKHRTKDGNYTIGKLVIKDKPAYKIRGIVIDFIQLKEIETSLFRNMQKLKLNTVIISGEDSKVEELKKLASNYNIKIFQQKDIMSKVMLISIEDDKQNISTFYNTQKYRPTKDGLLLNLTPIDKKFLGIKLTILAELAWCGYGKIDIDSLSRWTDRELTW